MEREAFDRELTELRKIEDARREKEGLIVSSQISKLVSFSLLIREEYVHDWNVAWMGMGSCGIVFVTECDCAHSWTA